MCRCVSTKPGITIMFAASITCAVAVMFGWTAAIFPPSISTSAVSKSPTFGSSERTQPPLSSVRPLCAAARVPKLAAARPTAADATKPRRVNSIGYSSSLVPAAWTALTPDS